MGWSNRAFLSRFSSDGVLDTGFGENGFYCFDFGNSNNPVFHIDSEYITAGWYNNENHKLISVHDDGSDGDYVFTTDMYYFQDMILQENNKIILGGGYQIDDTYNANFALERVIFNSESAGESNDFLVNDLIIFPNPAKEILYFNKETAFEIIDMQGRILLKSTVHVTSVNISNLVAGVYLIRSGYTVRKLVKE